VFQWGISVKGLKVSVDADGVLGRQDVVANPLFAPTLEKYLVTEWFTHAPCWVQLVLGERIRRCNASVEISINIKRHAASIRPHPGLSFLF
jgi:hypothetical protein